MNLLHTIGIQKLYKLTYINYENTPMNYSTVSDIVDFLHDIKCSDKPYKLKIFHDGFANFTIPNGLNVHSKLFNTMTFYLQSQDEQRSDAHVKELKTILEALTVCSGDDTVLQIYDRIIDIYNDVSNSVDYVDYDDL